MKMPVRYASLGSVSVKLKLNTTLPAYRDFTQAVHSLHVLTIEITLAARTYIVSHLSPTTLTLSPSALVHSICWLCSLLIRLNFSTSSCSRNSLAVSISTHRPFVLCPAWVQPLHASPIPDPRSSFTITFVAVFANYRVVFFHGFYEGMG